MDEVLKNLGTVEEPILKSSPIAGRREHFVDFSVKKQLDVHVRYSFLQRMTTIKT
jgi:hypothetical protein